MQIGTAFRIEEHRLLGRGKGLRWPPRIIHYFRESLIARSSGIEGNGPLHYRRFCPRSIHFA